MLELPLYPHLHGLLLLLTLIPAAIFNGLYRRIPNWLTFPAIGITFVLNGILYETQGLLFALVGFTAALILYGALFFLKGIGGGDVKLMMAIGATIGLRNWAGVAVCTAILGLVAAIVLIITKKRAAQTLANIRYIVSKLFRLEAPHHERPDLQVGAKNTLSMPHGIVISMGAAAYLGTAWVLTDF